MVRVLFFVLLFLVRGFGYGISYRCQVSSVGHSVGWELVENKPPVISTFSLLEKMHYARMP